MLGKVRRTGPSRTTQARHPPGRAAGVEVWRVMKGMRLIRLRQRSLPEGPSLRTASRRSAGGRGSSPAEAAGRPSPSPSAAGGAHALPCGPSPRTRGASVAPVSAQNTSRECPACGARLPRGRRRTQPAARGPAASAASLAAASSRASISWLFSPSRRMATVPSTCSRAPTTSRTGTLARLCSRTL